MARNETPYPYDDIIEHLEDAADGAHTHEVAIGLEQNKESDMRADRDTLAGTPAGPGGVPPATPGVKATWNAAKTNRTTKARQLRALLEVARALARTCVSTLRNVLGDTWNNNWNAAGFTDGSLAIPRNPMALLQQLRAYYIAHPAHEGTVAGIACTAAACEQMAQDISTAQSDANQAETDATIAKEALDAGLSAARRRLIGLREELAQLLDDDDERWYAFGFNRPSDPETPEIPENVTVTTGVPGSHLLTVDWDDARRANSYRVRLTHNGNTVTQTIAQDSEYTFALPSVASGQPVEVIVTARNNAGESLSAPPVTAVVP